MRRFTRLYLELDRTTRTSEKLAALRAYFEAAPARDAAWALMVLSGRKLLRTVSYPVLRDAACEVSGFPPWMLEECYGAVGDLSETIALLLPGGSAPDISLSKVYEEFIVPMGKSDAAGAAGLLKKAWALLPRDQQFIFHKLISGTFRVGVQRRLVVRALAEAAGVEVETMAHRLTGDFEPTAAAYAAIMSRDQQPGDIARPYPFCLAHQLDLDPATLGEAREWLGEWKWDGIRAQLIRRDGRTFLWSRGEEAIAAQFPEVARIGDLLENGTVLDGEVLAWSPDADATLPFKMLQTRLGRKDLQPSLFDRTTVMFMAFDLLESGGEDIRARPLEDRRAELANVVARTRDAGVAIRMSEQFAAENWEEFASARERAREMPAAEGLMLKHRRSVYHVGRLRGGTAAEGGAGWWKWKLDPYSVDAVLIYAQPGTGRRAGLFTDYTFGVWDGPALVPFAKAYSGLTDEELHQVDAFIRRHTLDRRGPVRFVEPALVFEIAFQEIHASTRHRSGVAVRFPRILRWRHDKRADQADTMERLRGLLGASEQR